MTGVTKKARFSATPSPYFTFATASAASFFAFVPCPLEHVWVFTARAMTCDCHVFALTTTRQRAAGRLWGACGASLVHYVSVGGQPQATGGTGVANTAPSVDTPPVSICLQVDKRKSSNARQALELSGAAA